MTPTEEYIHRLQTLKEGDLGMLRKLAGRDLDDSLVAFDLFAGLWWPLRAKSDKTPRREVAWLVAKLYAYRPLPQSAGVSLAGQLGKLRIADAKAADRRRRRFDGLLALPLNQIEPALRWAIALLASNDGNLDWVRLTNELSRWEREKTRIEWAEQFLQMKQ